MLSRYNYTKKLINLLVESCLDAALKPQFYDSIADKCKVESMVLKGTSYQIGIFYESLKSSRPYFNNRIRLDSVLVKLKDRLLENFSRSKFNFFDHKLLPDDLDTASIMVRVLEEDQVTEAYLNFVAKLKTRSEFVATWSTNNNHSPIPILGDNQFHVDVMLNYFLTCLRLDKNIKNPIKEIRNLIKNHGLINYWYIPCFYSTYLYSKLIISKKDLFHRIDIDILDKHTILYRKILNTRQESVPLNSCQVDRVRDIVKKENKNSWLNNAYYMGILSNKGVFLGNRTKTLDKLIMDRLHAVEMKRSETVPSIFWSMWFKPYKSSILNEALYLEILIRVFNYLGLKHST